MSSIIVAAALNNAIGLEGAMPWHLPADLKYFKTTTMGHPVVMGRKTYESIGRPLPGRRNLVISRQKGLTIEGCEVFHSLAEALAAAGAEAFVIGGGQIYREAWPLVDSLYLTRVHTVVDQYDAAIPEVSSEEWELISATPCPKDDRNAYDLTFEVYRRIE